MRNVFTLIIAGCIGFAGFTVCAQSQADLESMMQSLSTGSSSTSPDDIMSGFTNTAPSAEPQVSIINAPLFIDTDVPEVNQTFTPAYIGNPQTGRYPPRLKVNFTEFPLRSLSHTNRPTSGSPTAIVVQRVQNRLCSPQLHLVVKDRTAIVSGTVATERQRSLAEAMLRFEPGIDTVQNEIAVVPKKE